MFRSMSGSPYSIGPLDAAVRVLVVNPNSSQSFTDEVYEHLKTRLAPDILASFYTAPATAPASIDGTLDGVLSTAAVLRKVDIKQWAANFDGIVVACFSAHQLLPALKEAFLKEDRRPVVVGIMEAGIYTCLQLGHTFGIVTTGHQWEAKFIEHIRTMGVASSRVTGVKGTGFNAISLHGEGPLESMINASVELVNHGAESILLGCGGMAPHTQEIATKIFERTQKRVPVVDGVQAAIETVSGMTRMKLRT